MARTVLDLFRETASTRADATAARHWTGGAWRDVTWRDIASAVDAAAAGVVALGVQPGERVAILSNTRLEWSIADLAIMVAGAVSVPIYQSSTPAECEYILRDSGCIAAFVEDVAQLVKLRAVRAGIAAVRRIVCFDPPGPMDDGWVVPWSRFVEDGRMQAVTHAAEVARRARDLGPDDLFTIIYTSGTTGPPKGVMLVHDSFLYVAGAVRDLGMVRPDDVGYLFLPLAHVFARVLEAGWFATGHVQAFWRRDPRTIVDEVAQVRPTFFAAVPRVLEKIHARVVAEIEHARGLRGRLGRFALAHAHRAALAPDAAHRDPLSLFARAVVLRRIGRRLHARLGGRLRFVVSGGAPLSRDIAWFFHYAGIRVCEGYGLTESTGATCVNRPDCIHPGTVGTPLPGTELRIASDGEVLIRGRGIMRGYWGRAAATREVLDADGWFYTGDIGEIDADGYLRITDRKKDIIVTAGGKKVAPQNIEGALKTKNPLISHVVAHGDRRRYVTALVTLDPEALRGWASARGIEPTGFDYARLARHPDVLEEIQRTVDALNRELAGYEAIKRITILDHDFEVGDQLTPTLKVKRKLCGDRYAEFFDAMYRGESGHVARDIAGDRAGTGDVDRGAPGT